MQELNKEEAVEVVLLLDDIMREDPNTMYDSNGRIYFHILIEELYKNGFTVIKKE